MKVALVLLAVPAVMLPAACLVYIVVQAWPALHWGLIVGTAATGTNFGVDQALRGQIVGSLLMMVLACFLATPVAITVALFHALWATARQQAALLMFMQVLQGVPPIAYGLCGLIVFVHVLHWGISLAAGGVILAVIILPLLSINVIHALERIPRERTEAARLLGLNRVAIVARVWWPEAWPGMLTGLLLGMARALSETAPILFTATVFSGVLWPKSVLRPVTTLQTHIFYLAQAGADRHAVEVAWAAAVVLLGLVLVLSLSAWSLRRHGELR